MAKFSMQAPQINTEDLEDKEAIRRVQSYLYQLNEQLRYMMMNLDGENIQEGSIGETQLSRPVRQNIQNIEVKLGDQEQKSKTLADNFGNYYTKIETAQQIMTMMDDALGNYYTKIETASQITTMMGDALGNYYTKTETAQQISSYVGNALGDYSTTQQTAAAISAYVTNNAYQIQSGIAIDAYGVDVTGSKYVKIRSGGSFILDSDSLDINSTSGIIEASYNGDAYFRIAAGRTQILGLDLYSSYDGGYTDVTDTITRLEYYGWIRNASVSADGTTLTLTKWNGNTVNFSKAGSALASLLLESVSGSASSFRANAYDSSSAVLGYAGGEIYLDDTAANYNRNTWACVRPSGGSRIAYLPLSGYWDAAQAAVTPTAKTIIDIVGRITSGETYNSQTGIWGAKMRVTIYYSDNTYEVKQDVDINTSYLHT